MKKATDILQTMEANTKNLEFLPTGFHLLDNFLDGGFMRKELVILGGHTGIGKSYLAGQIFYNIAAKGFNSAYFSLEISNEMVVSRLVGQLANIKPTRIYAGLLNVEEYDQKSRAKAKVCMYDETMSFYDDIYLFSELEREIRTNKYEFIVIDFIQNILLTNNMDEYSRLSYISLALQKLAKETNCCMLILSQLSNRVAKDGSKIVEYKGSGGIATVCDLGFFIERDETQVHGINEVRLNLRKNRRGTSGTAFAFTFTSPGGLLSERL